MDLSNKINIPEPKFGDNITEIVLYIDSLRSEKLYGDVPVHIFFQLKRIFNLLENIGSSRIEGNNTTLSEYVEKSIERKNKESIDDSEGWKEIENINKAIEYVENNTDKNTIFNKEYFFEIHKIVVKDLILPSSNGEGSKKPGEFRKENVVIKNSVHVPPDFIGIDNCFLDFLDFINNEKRRQFQSLLIAVAHHRFSYIHPFDNGNGRVGRVMNYALLIKYGFLTKEKNIINPSAVFYSDRDMYYNMLGDADSLLDSDILK
jgi:Fic family protein